MPIVNGKESSILAQSAQPGIYTSSAQFLVALCIKDKISRNVAYQNVIFTRSNASLLKFYLKKQEQYSSEMSFKSHGPNSPIINKIIHL